MVYSGLFYLRLTSGGCCQRSDRHDLRNLCKESDHCRNTDDAGTAGPGMMIPCFSGLQMRRLGKISDFLLTGVMVQIVKKIWRAAVKNL